MNSEQFWSSFRTALKVGGTYLLAHGYFTAAQLNWVVGVGLVLAGWLWSHVTHKSVPTEAQISIRFPLLAVIAAALLAVGGGCTTVTEHGYQFHTTTRVFGLRVVTTSQPNSTPEVDLGFVSTTTLLNPTSTNGPINAARSMNSIDVKQTLNPFDTGIREQIGTGDVYLGGTNDVNKAIVPSAFTPLNLKGGGAESSPKSGQ